MQTVKQLKTLLIFRFYHYMWFIDSENLSFLFSKKKLQGLFP